MKTTVILPTAAYYSLTYGQLDGKTRILTNRGETTEPLPKYPAKPTDSSAFGAENLQSLNGLTPEERRVVAGGVVHRLK